MQGLKSPLSVEDIRFFTQLDNLFEYDLKTLRLNGLSVREGEVVVLLIGKEISLLVPEVR